MSVAEPSVWNQFVLLGTLRKRKYLTAPTQPVRSSIQSSGIRDDGLGLLATFGLRHQLGGMKG